MKNPRIYFAEPLQLGQTVELTEGAANHIARVLRMQAGDCVRLFGNGVEMQGEIISAERKRVAVKLIEQLATNTQSPLDTTIGIVMSKGDRMEYAIQKATEMGMTRLVPLTSERCELKLKGDREDKKLEHWQQVAISACEQCGLNQVPSIEPITSVKDFVAQVDSELKLVLHHRTEKNLANLAKPESVCCLIGPEGGLTAEEIALAEEHGFNALALGPRVLRTETAPVAVLSLLQYLWGDW